MEKPPIIIDPVRFGVTLIIISIVIALLVLWYGSTTDVFKRTDSMETQQSVEVPTEEVKRYIDWTAQVICYYTPTDIYCIAGNQTQLFTGTKNEQQ